MNNNFTILMNTTLFAPISSNFTVKYENSINDTQSQDTNVSETQNRNIYELVEWYIQVIHRPIVIVLGTIGNLLSFYVMRKGSLKEVSTCFYMAILALADTGVLWAGAFPIWIGQVTRRRVNAQAWTDCKFGYFLFFFSLHYSSTLLVVMCIEKFIALYFPLRVKTFCTVKTAKWVCSIAALLLAAFNSQFFFVYEARKNWNGYFYCTYVNVPGNYKLIFYQIHAIIHSFGPFTVMCIANSAIIYKFMVAKCRSRRESTESTSQALSKSAVKGTTMLVTVSVTFVILTGPGAFLVSITSSPDPLLFAVFVVMLNMNHSINAVLYCIVGSRFRNELMKTIKCCWRKEHSTQNDRTFSTAWTTDFSTTL